MTAGSDSQRLRIRIHPERGRAALRRGLVTGFGMLVAVLGFATVTGTSLSGALPTALFAGAAVGVTLGLLRYSTVDVGSESD